MSLLIDVTGRPDRDINFHFCQFHGIILTLENVLYLIQANGSMNWTRDIVQEGKKSGSDVKAENGKPLSWSGLFNVLTDLEIDENIKN